MRRRRYRCSSARWPNLHGSARHHGVWRRIVGQLRTQQVPLRRWDAKGLLDLALGSWPGISRHAIRMSLRQTEQHKRQHNEKPRQDRSKPSHIVRRRVCHPWAAQT